MTALAGGVSYPTAKFTNVGTCIAGRIIDFADVQERDYNSKKPKWWGENGKPVDLDNEAASARGLRPVEQTRVTLETQPGNQSSRVSLYISGQRMVRAVKSALAAAGANDIAVMADIAITYTGNEGMAKLYSAVYDPYDPTARAAA